MMMVVTMVMTVTRSSMMIVVRMVALRSVKAMHLPTLPMARLTEVLDRVRHLLNNGVKETLHGFARGLRGGLVSAVDSHRSVRDALGDANDEAVDMNGLSVNSVDTQLDRVGAVLDILFGDAARDHEGVVQRDDGVLRALSDVVDHVVLTGDHDGGEASVALRVDRKDRLAVDEHFSRVLRWDNELEALHERVVSCEASGF